MSELQFIETSAQKVHETIISELENGVNDPLYPGDERRIFGEALVPVFVALYNSLNEVGRQTLLRYARGEVLDAIRRCQPDTLTPIEAMSLIYEWKQKLN